jgi:hypothetical protein
MTRPHCQGLRFPCFPLSDGEVQQGQPAMTQGEPGRLAALKKATKKPVTQGEARGSSIRRLPAGRITGFALRMTANKR